MTDQTLFAKLNQQIDQSFALEGLRIAAMELQQIKIVGAQSMKAGFEIAFDDVWFPNVFDLEVILVLLVRAAAFGSQVEFTSAMADESPDTFFAASVVGRCIDEVDAGVEYRVEESISVGVGNYANAPGARTTQAHAAVTKLRDLKPGATELFFCKSHGRVHVAGLLTNIFVPERRLRSNELLHQRDALGIIDDLQFDAP